jgi:hypothetical protein
MPLSGYTERVLSVPSVVVLMAHYTHLEYNHTKRCNIKKTLMQVMLLALKKLW